MTSMSITVRKATEADRKTFNWESYYVGHNGPFRPTVVTMSGVIHVVMQGQTVLWQSGSAVVPDLVRIAQRAYRAWEKSSRADWTKRGEPFRGFEDLFMRGRQSKAGG